MPRMQDKVALITGGASGIGAACAELFAAEGAAVVLTDIQRQQGEQVATKIEKAGGEALFLQQDVTEEMGWNEVVLQIIERHGRLDVLVNNAGICIGGPVQDYSLESWQKSFQVNVEAVFLGTRYCLPHLAAEGGGAIVNLSSIAGLQGAPGLAAYCATKGAVRLFTKAVAKECAMLGQNVRCNSVHPGIIETPIWTSMFEDGPKWPPGANEPLTPQQAAEAIVPGARVGSAAEVAEAVLFLASDAASYVNGAELAVDYGVSS